MPAARPARILVVTPVFNEEAVLPELFARLGKVFADNPGREWGAVLVDDGSADASARLLDAQSARDPRFAAVRLSRNFGFQAALAAGLAEAERREVDAVITMDADLQDPPELIPRLLAAWENGGRVVRALRATRAETGLRRLCLDAFHLVFNRLTDFPIENNTGTFCLLDREVVRALNRLPERHRFFPGLRAWVGFEQVDIRYDRADRAAGEPKQTFRRLVRYAMDGLFGFSNLPLRALTYAGVFIGSLGFLLGLYYVVKRLIHVETAPTGFTTLAALILFLGGIQLIGIGVLGEYLARIHDEAKQRPLYLVKPPAKSMPSEKQQ